MLLFLEVYYPCNKMFLFFFNILIVMHGAACTTNMGLDEFTESLSKFTKFSSIRTLANLGYASDIYSTSNIVSR